MAKNSSSRLTTPTAGTPAVEAPQTGPRRSFKDVDRLRSADGVVAVISQRLSTGRYTFGIFKEFERDGQVEQTSFFPEEMLASYSEMLKKVGERIDLLKKTQPAAAR